MRISSVALGILMAVAMTGCGSKYDQAEIDKVAARCGSEVLFHVDPHDSQAYDAAFVSCAQHALPKLSHDDALTLAHKENGAY